MINYFAYIIIVPKGNGSKVRHTAFEYGVTNSTILQGLGTVKDGFLNMLGFYDEQKEIIIMLADEGIGSLAIENIAKKYKMHKPHNGIIFTILLNEAFGVDGIDIINKKEDEMSQKAIFTVVDRGLSSQVIECAKEAGATGGTIILGRGSGIENAPKLFNIEIEPEKELVLIIVDNNIKDQVVSAIRKEMHIDDPNKGIVFVLNLHETFGLYQKDN